jgi:uncharacterized protein
MVRLGSWIVRRRVIIVVATLMLLAAAAAVMPRIRIDASSRNLLFSASEAREAFLRYAERWGSDRLLVLTVETPDDGGIFSAELLRYLQTLTGRLDALDAVERTESLTNTTVLVSAGETLKVQPIVPRRLPTDAAALEAIKRRALASPLLRRLLVDDAGGMSAINLRLRYDETNPKVLLGSVTAVRRVIAQVARPDGVKVRTVGGPVLLETTNALIERDAVVLTLAPLGLVGLFLIVFFRSLRGVLLPLGIVVATALATFGALIVSGHAINLVTSSLPALVMVIGVADAVHVLVAHQEATAALAREGREVDGRRAAAMAVARVGLPCLLTSLTTAAGFGSLAVSEISQVREFGIFAAIGVLMAFVFAVVSLPAALALLPAPRPRLQKAHRRDLGQRLRRLKDHYPRLRYPVLLGAALLAVIGGLGLARLRVESSVVTYLPEDLPIHADLMAVEKRLTGTVPIVIHLWDREAAAAKKIKPAPASAPTSAPTSGPASGEVEQFDDPEDEATADLRAAATATDEAPEQLRDPKVLQAIDLLTAALKKVQGVRKIVAITEYLKEVNRVMRGGGDEHYALPQDRKVIATYLELVSGQDADAMGNLLAADRSAANVTILTSAHNSSDVQRILAAIQAALDRPEIRSRLGSRVAVDVTGLGPLLASVADRIVSGQLKSCFLALAVICLMFVLVLWSLRTALVALVPNVLPILFTVGLMGWVGVSLNVTTVMIASIALGIAVDDTIHMLVRTRQEARLSGDHQDALGHALASSGQAIVITTFVVGGGFLVLLLASLNPPRHFGLFTSLTMFVALIADLLLLPVLILWLRPWKRGDVPKKST